MAILVCGGAGYIGSHINKQLNKEGYETIVFDNLVYGHQKAVKWGTFVKGDLANKADIEAVFSSYKIDAVFHFAAYAYVGESVTEPEKYYYNNVVNTLNLLHVMKQHGCNRIIFSSTCATYGEPKRVPITEDMAQNPRIIKKPMDFSLPCFAISMLPVQIRTVRLVKAIIPKPILFRWYWMRQAERERIFGYLVQIMPRRTEAASGITFM